MNLFLWLVSGDELMRKFIVSVGLLMVIIGSVFGVLIV